MKNIIFLTSAIIFCLIACYPAKAVSPKYATRMVVDTVCHESDTAVIAEMERGINMPQASDSVTMPPNENYSSRSLRKHRVKQYKDDSGNPYLVGNIASGVVFSFILTVTIVMLRLI